MRFELYSFISNIGVTLHLRNFIFSVIILHYIIFYLVILVFI